MVEGRLQAEGNSNGAARVSQVSLAQVMEDAGEVDLLKIDVEGAEYDIVLRSDPGVRSCGTGGNGVRAVNPTDPRMSSRHPPTTWAALASGSMKGWTP